MLLHVIIAIIWDTTRYCTFNEFVINVRTPNVRRKTYGKKINTSISTIQYENINETFVKENNGGSRKAWTKKEKSRVENKRGKSAKHLTLIIKTIGNYRFRGRTSPINH